MPNAGHADEPEEIDVAFANDPAPGLHRFWSLMSRVLGSFPSATKVHVGLILPSTPLLCLGLGWCVPSTPPLWQRVPLPPQGLPTDAMGKDSKTKVGMGPVGLNLDHSRELNTRHILVYIYPPHQGGT